MKDCLLEDCLGSTYCPHPLLGGGLPRQGHQKQELQVAHGGYFSKLVSRGEDVTLKTKTTEEARSKLCIKISIFYPFAYVYLSVYLSIYIALHGC